MTSPVLQREIIVAALEHLLEWPEIARSSQLARFLEYIVNCTLDGQEQSIKAYSIAVDVFGRAPDFDPQADPIVRVQARRLRSLLDDYYSGPGLHDAVQIRLPVGRYIPEFVTAHAEALPDSVAGATPVGVPIVPPRAVRNRPGVSWYVLVVIALGTAMGAYALSTWGPRQQIAAASVGALQAPTINVVEFQNLAQATQSPPQVAGLAIELVTDLEQFENINVHYRVGSEVQPTEDLPVNDFVLTGIVRLDGDVVQYSAILTESRTGTVVWNQTLSVPAGEAATPGVLDRVSQAFGLVLGSPRGPLHAPARQLLAAGTLGSADANLYLCRVMFDRYRETGASADAAEAGACLGTLPEIDKQSALALAANASLIAEQGGSPAPDDASAAERFRLAEVNMANAIGLDPIGGFIWEQQARLHEGQGDLNMARADYASAVQLNPANADALAAFARLLALAGGLHEAEQMARDAAERSPAPPPWYFGVPALLALRDGDFARAVESAELYAQADRELGPILAIMAAQRAGDSAVVNRYLPQVLEAPAFHAKGVLPRLRERISDDGLVEDIRTALSSAGVPWATLTRPF
ncbi:hypothetical protein SAMN05428969_1781 [Devosia sp. YR412]|uniref:hypothetical protein n=1 Tax=Devosia sp. YR412 TaxID=1881030 RepID=UPI0008D3F6A9|nr:hypothetical protein [Devosia sp. YR412]SEQ06350.1 hypothetical protein SAMN05428969_1781 [Devosia sp. YR412]